MFYGGLCQWSEPKRCSYFESFQIDDHVDVKKNLVATDLDFGIIVEMDQDKDMLKIFFPSDDTCCWVQGLFFMF